MSTSIVTVADLKENAGRTFLHCRECDGRFSATKGDYFWLPSDHVMKCCDAPMHLVVEQRKLVEVL